jgi:hypothetical protein
LNPSSLLSDTSLSLVSIVSGKFITGRELTAYRTSPATNGRS